MIAKDHAQKQGPSSGPSKITPLRRGCKASAAIRATRPHVLASFVKISDRQEGVDKSKLLCTITIALAATFVALAPGAGDIT
jgi:hypothetical protein